MTPTGSDCRLSALDSLYHANTPPQLLQQPESHVREEDAEDRLLRLDLQVVTLDGERGRDDAPSELVVRRLMEAG